MKNIKFIQSESFKANRGKVADYYLNSEALKKLSLYLHNKFVKSFRGKVVNYHFISKAEILLRSTAKIIFA
jgi:hypothetical protein